MESQTTYKQNNELGIDHVDEERKDEFDIHIRQLMCQPCDNEYADISDCEYDSGEESGYKSAMESRTEYESENDSKVRSVRACPVIDLFASRLDTKEKWPR